MIRELFVDALYLPFKWIDKKAKEFEQKKKFIAVCEIERESIEKIEQIVEQYPIGWEQVYEIVSAAVPIFCPTQSVERVVTDCDITKIYSETLEGQQKRLAMLDKILADAGYTEGAEPR